MLVEFELEIVSKMIIIQRCQMKNELMHQRTSASLCFCDPKNVRLHLVLCVADYTGFHHYQLDRSVVSAGPADDEPVVIHRSRRMERLLKRNSKNGSRRRPGTASRRSKINNNGKQIVSSENVDNEVLLQKLLRALPPPWPWQGLVDFTPRALSRRLCARPQSNQLYRSDSFKFERFHPDDSASLDITPFRRQVFFYQPKIGFYFDIC